ncbi:MAG: hypothetical protein OEY89_15600 [Gammaproteobacteria bacterium]|nr:hypothetical protein [Gammaproteobacteria bacterium]
MSTRIIKLDRIIISVGEPIQALRIARVRDDGVVLGEANPHPSPAPGSRKRQPFESKSD